MDKMNVNIKVQQRTVSQFIGDSLVLWRLFVSSSYIIGSSDQSLYTYTQYIFNHDNFRRDFVIEYGNVNVSGLYMTWRSRCSNINK